MFTSWEQGIWAGLNTQNEEWFIVCKQLKTLFKSIVDSEGELMTKKIKHSSFAELEFKLTNSEKTHWKFAWVSEPVKLRKEEEHPHMKFMEMQSKYVSNSTFFQTCLIILFDISYFCLSIQLDFKRYHS